MVNSPCFKQRGLFLFSPSFSKKEIGYYPNLALEYCYYCGCRENAYTVCQIIKIIGFPVLGYHTLHPFCYSSKYKSRQNYNYKLMFAQPLGKSIVVYKEPCRKWIWEKHCKMYVSVQSYTQKVFGNVQFCIAETVQTAKEYQCNIG